MPKIVELNDISEYPPIPLEKDENGLYPYPTMRCGVIPYCYRKGHPIIWGGVKSDRIGPTTIALPAGIQDVLIIKDGRRFVLEVGKPFPGSESEILEYDFLQIFVGKFFRDQTYQDIITCLVSNKFEIYVENPLVTALHETHEEHGVYLQKNEGRDHYLLNTLRELPIQRLSGQRGADAECFWIASLNNTDGIVLKDTKKIENKIRRNFGREFYEQGCWGTLSEFKDALVEARKFSPLPSQEGSLIKMSIHPELIMPHDLKTLLGGKPSYALLNGKVYYIDEYLEWNEIPIIKVDKAKLEAIFPSVFGEVQEASPEQLVKLASLAQKMALITGVLEAYEETIEFLERIELLITADFKKSAFPLGLARFFSRPSIKEILTIKTALRNISHDTWLVLDLDNTVMEPMLEVGSDQWFTSLRDYAVKISLDSKEAMQLVLSIYAAVQVHIRTKAVESEIVKIIKALQDIGIPVFALTARNIATKQATIRQLNAIGIDFSRRNSIKIDDPSYEKGIIFCNARNKGEVWEQFIKKCPTLPTDVVMLDDNKRHLERMLKAMKMLKINFTGLRYGFLDEKVSAFDMRPATHQLAYLAKYLPKDVQDAIASLQLIPYDFDSVSAASRFSNSFFSGSDDMSLLSGSHISFESNMVCFPTQ